MSTLIVTGESDPERIERLRDLGFLLGKPLSPEALKRALAGVRSAGARLRRRHALGQMGDAPDAWATYAAARLRPARNGHAEVHPCTLARTNNEEEVGCESWSSMTMPCSARG